MDAFATEYSGVRIFGIVDRNIVQIKAARLGSIRFFLLNVFHSVAFAQILQGFTQAAEADLRKLLIGFLAEVHRACEVWIVAADYCADLVVDAVIDDVTGGLADVILNTVVPLAGEAIESMGFLCSLLVSNALVMGLLLVPVLVD